MANALTVKGQVTIPKRIRDTLGLQPGDMVGFEINTLGQVVVSRAGSEAAAPGQDPDRFEKLRGCADYKWGSTREYMKFIRGDDYDQD